MKDHTPKLSSYKIFNHPFPRILLVGLKVEIGNADFGLGICLLLAGV